MAKATHAFYFEERERERELGTGFLFEEPNPTGSRPSDLIGFCEGVKTK